MRDNRDRGSVGPTMTIALCGVVLVVGCSAWVGWLIAGQIEPAVGVAVVCCALLLGGLVGLLVRTGIVSIRIDPPAWLRRAEDASRAEPKQGEAVRRVVALGAEEARHFRHERIGTEHLLVGIMREGGEGTRVLKASGVTLEALIRAVDTVAGTGDAAETLHPELSAPARRALENAAARARADRSRSVQVRHLLLALAQEKGGVAAAILDHFGCTAASLTAAFARRNGG